MINGILNIYKEKGWTSHDVVARLRGIVGQKKIGHTGTLDPDAEGVLPVCLGRATKVCDLLTDKDKTYETVLLLGKTTDTQDITGTVLAEQQTAGITEEDVLACIRSFVGEYDQIPPMYSALKVNGRKLYEIAREGKTVERKPRTVFFHSIEIQDMELPLVKISVTCSRGTYIRTLCHDIGKKLGCGACMEELVRTRSGQFRLEDSLTLEEIREHQEQGDLDRYVMKIGDVLEEYPILLCSCEMDRLLLNGNSLDGDMFEKEYHTGWVRMCTSSGAFIGLYQWNPDEGRYCPVKMFL